MFCGALRIPDLSEPESDRQSRILRRLFYHLHNVDLIKLRNPHDVENSVILILIRFTKFYLKTIFARTKAII